MENKNYFTIVPNLEVFLELENNTLKEKFEFFFALFFKGNGKKEDRDFLLSRNLLILYITYDKDKKTIHGGNLENVSDKEYVQLSWEEFNSFCFK